jgi:predicted RND superfamily exporter protein
MSRFERIFGQFVVKQRWWIIMATVMVVLASASGVRFLTISNDTRVFFSEENPQLQALEALENTYSKDNNVLFVIAPENANVFTRNTLAAVEDLTQASWQMPYSSRVDSLSNFQHTRAEEDDLIVEDLVQNASRTGHVTGVNVTIMLPGQSLEEVPQVAAFARQMADDFRRNTKDIDIYLTGGLMSDNAFGEAGFNDMSTLVPAMFFILIILVGISLRAFTGTLGTLIIILISMVTGMGLAGWLGITLSPASVNAPLIILALAVADSVHLLVTMFQQMRLGRTKHEAIAESLRINLQPVFLTSITTVIGFLTMNFSDTPPFRDLGNIVAMGVTAAFVYSVLFLPSLMAVIPVRVKPKVGSVECHSCNRLADFVIKQRHLMFWVTLALIVVLTAGTLRIELNDNWIKYFDKSYDIRKATDFAEENLTGFHAIEYSLESGETGGINNPEYLLILEKFARWYRQQPKVVNVNTIAETIKRLNKNMHADDESFYRIPDQRELAAQYLLLYEMSLPFGLDLNNQINVDKSATRMTVILKDTTTKELRQMDQKAREWLKANAPASMFTYGSGLSIIFAHISERNINSMLGASFGALGLISLILIVALRSFKLGVISLIPNVVPAIMAFGLWGILVGQIGLGLSVVAAMTLGIVVDDTVHFMSKYLRARREHGMNPSAAVRYSFNTVGTALWVTTLALVAGFSVLAFSGYRMSSDMGLMTAITITLALALDFLFLPTLLMKVEEKTDETTAFNFDRLAAPVTARSDGRNA